MDIKVLYNYDENLYCTECKRLIEVGEKFVIVYNEDSEGKFEQIFHPECLPETDSEDPYISTEE